MGRKRKGLAPKRADESKRQLTSWNMQDLAKVSGIHVISDDDPAISEESAAAATSSRCPASKSTAAAPITDIDNFLAKCDFYLSIQRSVPSDSWICFFGEFEVELTEQSQLISSAMEKGGEFWLYVDSCSSYYLYSENKQGRHQVCIGAATDFPYACSEALQMKCFSLVMKEYDARSKLITLDVYGNRNCLTELKFSSDGWRPRKRDFALQSLMAYFYNIQPPDYSQGQMTKKHDVQLLFEDIKQFHTENPNEVPLNTQHPSLRPMLRTYQEKAVQWMLARERLGSSTTEKEVLGLHPLYTKVVMKDGKQLFYCKDGGYLVEKEPILLASPPGGILADEMGLGKTVEVLSCILCHPRADVGRKSEEKVEEVSPGSCKITSPDAVKCFKNTDDASLEGKMSGSNDPNEILQVESSDEAVINNSELESEDTSAVKCFINTDDASLEGEMSGSNVSKSNEILQIKSSDEAVINNSKLESQNTSAKITNTTEESENCELSEGSELMNDEHSYSVSSVRKSEVDQYQHYEDTIEEVVIKVCGKRRQSSPRRKKSPKKAKSDELIDDGVHVECVCGNKTSREKRTKIQCAQCLSWQHSECMNYEANESKQSYLCPHCHAASPSIPSGATLIVSPSTICHQWVDEILKHIRDSSLRVLVYNGVYKQGYIQPQTLVNQDIVITTYETLGREINYVDLPHAASDDGRRFRNPKRFMATPSPITCVEWWRICLDEAQMVECTTTKTAEMALRLSAVNKWCVTGTPVQRSIEDLYGLLLFLGVEPVWVKHWWTKLLYEPYCYGSRLPLIRTCGQVLWRTCKKDVLNQIGLPSQTEEMHVLTFSPVEEHFYRRQYDKCAGEALGQLAKFADQTTKLNSLDRHTLHQLLYPLLRLRQACCHPQVVKGEFIPLNKSTMSMEDLLDQLIKKTKQEGEEGHRQFVAALNGSAALAIIEEDLPAAVDHYRTALRSIEEHRSKLRTDDLQELHTLYNLNEVLSQKPPGVDPTLRDGDLPKQAADIKEKYLAKAASSVAQSQDAWTPLRESLADLRVEWKGEETWWVELLQWVMSQALDEQLLSKVREDLEENSFHGITNVNFRDVRSLEFVIMRHLDQLEEGHKELVQHLNSLCCLPTPALINETVECCLRPADELNIAKTCPFCKADDMFEKYEAKLYSFVDKKSVASAEDRKFLVGSRRQGTWADSQLERTLKSLISYSKMYHDTRQLGESGCHHIKIFDAQKKEFKGLRSVWMALREQVSAFDEIDMATLRFRLRYEDEPATETPQPHIIERAQVDQQKLKHSSDEIIGRNERQKKLSQLMYLENLAKTQKDLDDGCNPELCPVCMNKLGSKWSVFPCGHCFCLECIKVLFDRSNVGGRQHSIRCPVCRQTSTYAGISYVNTRSKSDDAEGTHVKGDHSTKIAGVIQCLKEIKRRDPTAKSLVFSTWHDVLDVLSQALTDNNISFRSLHFQNRFQANLQSFKEDDDVSVLLLPVHSGANGLNLIEATHVLLVEPILNPAQELQAIGRIHRIGQDKPTVVHRFQVRGTIEEPLSSLLKASPHPVEASLRSEEMPFTINDLRSLFRISHEASADPGANTP